MTVLTILAALAAAVAPAGREGDISHMGDTPVPERYLAIPCRTPDNTICGLTVELCGPAACEVLRQTDYGPSQRVHPDRIADVSPSMFAKLCGVPPSAGLCAGSWHVVDELAPTLPPTDGV